MLDEGSMVVRETNPATVLESTPSRSANTESRDPVPPSLPIKAAMASIRSTCPGIAKVAMATCSRARRRIERSSSAVTKASNPRFACSSPIVNAGVTNRTSASVTATTSS